MSMAPFGLLLALIAGLSITTPLSAEPVGSPPQHLQTRPAPIAASDPRTATLLETALLNSIASWLSQHFALPAMTEPPRIRFAPQNAIVALRYSGLLQAGAVVPEPNPSAAPQPPASDVISVYADATRTIYLPENWRGATPDEMSVLVHEMVHHLQNLSGEKFACPQAREKTAYAAQERWLGLFGRSLEQDFQIDGMTLLVKTNCGM